jgi:hypothetical protein
MTSRGRVKIVGRTYGTSALLLCASHFKIWKPRYTGIFFEFCTSQLVTDVRALAEDYEGRTGFEGYG